MSDSVTFKLKEAENRDETVRLMDGMKVATLILCREHDNAVVVVSKDGSLDVQCVVKLIDGLMNLLIQDAIKRVALDTSSWHGVTTEPPRSSPPGGNNVH